MGNRHVHKIECLQTLGTSESERQKVTALNLFYPTASPPFAKGRFFGIATQPLRAESLPAGRQEGAQYKRKLPSREAPPSRAGASIPCQ